MNLSLNLHLNPLPLESCASCGQTGARLWAVPGVDTVHCVACCPLSENAYPAVRDENRQLKTPTQITAGELEAWEVLPLWPLELQRAWLLRQMEPIAVAGAKTATVAEGDWSRPIRSYLGPELRAAAASRGLGVEALTPEDWEDFAARFDALISIARVHKRMQVTKATAKGAPSCAVLVHLGSIGWGRGDDLPWKGVDGEMAAVYVSEYLRERLIRSGEWGAIDTLDIQRGRRRVVVAASSTMAQREWTAKIGEMVKDFLSTGWREVYELREAAKPVQGASLCRQKSTAPARRLRPAEAWRSGRLTG